MENSPPGIQTIPGGALCGVGVVLGFVSAKTAFAIAGLTIGGLAGLAAAAGAAAEDSIGAAAAILALASAFVPRFAE
jgi:hypothetical protein